MAPIGGPSNSSGGNYTKMPREDARTWRMVENGEEQLAAIEEGESDLPADCFDDSQSLLSADYNSPSAVYSQHSDYTSPSAVYSQYSESGFASTAMSASIVSSLYTVSEGSDEEGSLNVQALERNKHEKFRKVRKGITGGVLAISFGIVAWYGVHFVSSRQPGLTSEALQPPAGIIRNPEFRALLQNEIQPLMQNTHASRIASGVNSTLNRLDNFVVKRLPQEQRDILEKQQISARTWADFAALAKAMRDPRVKDLGKDVFNVIRNASIFDGPTTLSLKIVDHLMPRASELNAMRKELIPSTFTDALHKWSREHLGNATEADSHSKVWRGMLDPSITKLMRGNGTIEIDLTEGRRLNMGTWAHPVLNPFETTLGITAVVLVTAMEILIHVEILNPKFSMPTWGWMAILVPTHTVAVWTCVTGLSLWCDLVFGALGLNVLDAFYLIFTMR